MRAGRCPWGVETWGAGRLGSGRASMMACRARSGRVRWRAVGGRASQPGSCWWGPGEPARQLMVGVWGLGISAVSCCAGLYGSRAGTPGRPVQVLAGCALAACLRRDSHQCTAPLCPILAQFSGAECAERGGRPGCPTCSHSSTTASTDRPAGGRRRCAAGLRAVRPGCPRAHRQHQPSGGCARCARKPAGGNHCLQRARRSRTCSPRGSPPGACPRAGLAPATRARIADARVSTTRRGCGRARLGTADPRQC